jgi:hypothetical protein
VPALTPSSPMPSNPLRSSPLPSNPTASGSGAGPGVGRVPAGQATSPVRGRHRASEARAAADRVPRDPSFPDYPYYLAHDAEARSRHLYALAGRRWGRHPGYPALDQALHLPARRPVAGVQPVRRLGDVALTAAALVTGAAWVIAVADPLPRGVALLSLAWVPAYLAACMWLELTHANSVAVAPKRQRRRSLAWPWLGWFTPFAALWVPKWLVDDAMWALPRAGLVHRVRWSGWWWTSFVLGTLAWVAAVAGPMVPVWPGELGWAPDPLGDLARDLRFAAAGLLTAALLLWAPIVGRLSMISDQLVDVKRSTLAR